MSDEHNTLAQLRPGLLSPTDLVGCRYRVLARERYGELPRSRAALLRAERLAAGRESVIALLPTKAALGDPKRFLRIDIAPLPLTSAGAVGGDPAEALVAEHQAHQATLEALAAGAHLITGALFYLRVDGLRFRVPVDILHRQSDGSYLPVVVSNHRVARRAERATTSLIATQRLGLGAPVTAPYRLRHHASDTYRLGCAFLALEDLGLAGQSVGVIGQDRERAFIEEAAPLVGVLQQALAAPVPTQPRRIKECASCRFWSRCEEQLAAVDDISLYLPGDRGSSWREAGITTVEGLIQAHRFPESQLAAAWRAGIPLLATTDEISVPRAEVEIDIDMEAYLDQGAYLWGCFDGRDYRGFATWEPLGGAAEARNFAEFWAWLSNTRAQAQAQGRSFAAYCWSAHGENHWLRMSARRFHGRFVGVPSEEEIDQFIASPEWIDLFPIVRSQLVGPFGLGLKVVAPVAGFQWQEEDFDGEESVHARRIARGEEDSALAMRARLLSYNADDTRASAAVRAWLSAGAAGTPRLRPTDKERG